MLLTWKQLYVVVCSIIQELNFVQIQLFTDDIQYNSSTIIRQDGTFRVNIRDNQTLMLKSMQVMGEQR